VTINKTISIINDGVGEAGVLVSGGLNGITINAGASDSVSLRGLTVKGIGFGGGSGIVFNSGKSLTIENCAVRNLTATTRWVTAFCSNRALQASLTVTNTLVADNSINGIIIVPLGSGAVKASLNRVELYNNGFAGLNVLGNFCCKWQCLGRGADSVATNSGNSGFKVETARRPCRRGPHGVPLRGEPQRYGRSGRWSGNNRVCQPIEHIQHGLGWTTLSGGILQTYGDNVVSNNVTSGNVGTLSKQIVLGSIEEEKSSNP